MKRGLVFFACALLLFTALPSAAADLSVGAACWYAKWDYSQGGKDDSLQDALLYGPVLALSFGGKWSVTSIFLYGRFDQKASSEQDYIDRFDSDTALNYNISRYLKVFGGVKFMGFYDNRSFDHQSIGPAAGLGLTLPLGADFFLLGNLSGIYNRAWENEAGGKKQHFWEPGANVTLSLAYYIEKASTTISLGGRFQYFRVVPDNNAIGNDMDHFIYGATLSAVYAFGI